MKKKISTPLHIPKMTTGNIYHGDQVSSAHCRGSPLEPSLHSPLPYKIYLEILSDLTNEENWPC